MADLPDGELMQRAAHGLALVVAARLPNLPVQGGESARVVVLAGAGGNGGDALFAAAFLAQESDASVVAVCTGPAAHPPALAAARSAGVPIVELFGSSADSAAKEPTGSKKGSKKSGKNVTPDRYGLTEAAALVAEADLVIDGMYGIGGRPGLVDHAADDGGQLWQLVQAIPDDAYIVAVDLPSGADPAGERPVADAVFADETVTFGMCKPVHVLAGADATGLLTVVDIGLAEPVTPHAAARLVHDDIAAFWPVPGPGDDKYSRGVLGVVAGGMTYTGAAVLAVTAAVSAGAGMVRYIGPRHPSELVRFHVPEAVFGPGRVQAWLVGPGLDPQVAADDSIGAAQVAAAREALAAPEPCVVDAGGLDLLEGPRPQAGARTLLTPHAGELARLLSRLEGASISRAQVDAEPVAHARRAAQALRATVLLKGATTYVVPPTDSLPVFAQADAPPWLATAGSGDVLAGLAGTLLAAGLDPLVAGALAAQVHGLAGHEANPDGPVRALDVARAIPRVVAAALRRRNALLLPGSVREEEQ
nr:bifunctional ADP-dependent NAD(P)H-hydrate dehydratase/NAD(P)H-hydrate epimerase [Kineosphaera limosa]